MKAENLTTGHNRTIRLTEIPLTDGPAGNDVSEMLIQVSYSALGPAASVIDKAIALDGIVIPAIIAAINRD